MTFDELVAKASAEPPRVEERQVAALPQELLAARRPILLSALKADPRLGRERRTFRKGHLFGPPLAPENIDAWRRERPGLVLPEDLRALLLRANGIHLWANLDCGRSCEGLAPLGEWELARTKMWGPSADSEDLGDDYLAISYHADGAAFVVLKVTTGEYFLMDSCGADESCKIGNDVSSLLDWFWHHRIP